MSDHKPAPANTPDGKSRFFTTKQMPATEKGAPHSHRSWWRTSMRWQLETTAEPGPCRAAACWTA